MYHHHERRQRTRRQPYQRDKPLLCPDCGKDALHSYGKPPVYECFICGYRSTHGKQPSAR